MNRIVGWCLAFHGAVFSGAVAAALAATAPEEGGYGSGSMHRSFEWREPTGAGRAAGHYLMDFVSAGMVQRVLVEDPTGRQIRITKSLDSQRGLATEELLDEASGWRAHLYFDFGLQAETLSNFFRADLGRSLAGQSAPVRLRFEADGMSPVVAQVAPNEPGVMNASIAEAVRSSAAGETLPGRLPDGLAEAILFLDASMSPEPLESRSEGDNVAHDLRGLVEVLAAVLRAAPPEGLDVGRYETPWPMTVRPIERGRSSVDPAVLEFVSRFRSVQNADPLADRPAAEAFGDPPPPS